MKFVGLTDRKRFLEHYLKLLLETGLLFMTVPDKKNGKLQAVNNKGYLSCASHMR